jgi:hypothetical protein
MIRLGNDQAEIHFVGGNKKYTYDVNFDPEFPNLSDVTKYLLGENISVGRRVNALIKSGVFTAINA